jgi:D-ribulokinase
MTEAVLGLDIGTSGVRGIITNSAHDVLAYASTSMPDPIKTGDSITQDATIWWQAVCTVLDELRAKIAFSTLQALSIDGTSGTILAIDHAGQPLAPASMYNDSSAKAAALRIADLAPPETAAHGATSPLGRALALQNLEGIAHILHQADWIAAQLSGHFGVSDENNALKTGYDPVSRKWPEWIRGLGLNTNLLPQVVPVGVEIGRISARMQARFGFNADTRVISGTTDGCAAFLATGADRIGAGVTSLGTTLVIKLLCETPIFAPEYGIYSHRIGNMWLAGGASNSGGAALLRFFNAAQMADLEGQMQIDQPTGLDFYPLAGSGERFPIYDPQMLSRVSPRPASDAAFLQALLEGIANVEALAYGRMRELGGPMLREVFTVGGGAKNTSWSKIRARSLGIALRTPASEDAAAGTARLAWQGLGHK